mgnify:FL=1
MFNISPGTSRVKAFKGFLSLLADDIKTHKYYREYSSSQGEYYVREVIAAFENIKLKNQPKYDPSDICITDGATGSISQIFEYFKKTFPNGEVLIPVPSYYIFVFTAKYYCLSYKEILPSIKPSSGKSIFTGKDILDNITDKTKMIILNQPHNPTGYIFTNEEIAQILLVAKRKGILVLADDLFFDLIFKNPHHFKTVDQLALENGALENVVTVKAYSKNRNLPGFRIGYLFSKNKKLINFLSLSLEQRVFFSGGSNFRSVIIMDCLFQSLAHMERKYPKVNHSELIKKVKNIFNFCEFIRELPERKISTQYTQFKSYMNKTMSFYSKNYDLIEKILKNDLEILLPKESAFNTFVKISGLDKVNIFDFSLNLFLSSGIMSDAGPSFGLRQSDWEQNKNLGYWVRITFSAKPSDLKNGLQRLSSFKREYLLNPERFIHTNLRF